MIKSLIINIFLRYRACLCTSICFFAFFFAFFLPGHSSAAINFDRLLSLASQQYGARGQQNITDLRTLLSQLQGATEQEKLLRINMFVNQKIRIFGNDIDIWGQSDYWATPLESLGREAGDCEDFSIAKYMFLRELGISNDKLRLTYVRAQIGGPNELTPEFRIPSVARL